MNKHMSKPLEFDEWKKRYCTNKITEEDAEFFKNVYGLDIYDEIDSAQHILYQEYLDWFPESRENSHEQ